MNLFLRPWIGWMGGAVALAAVTWASLMPLDPGSLPSQHDKLAHLAAYGTLGAWFGLFMPAGSPMDAIRGVNAEVQAMLALPETRTRFAQMGGVPAPGSPEDFATFVRAEIEKWGGVIRREGLQMDAT